MFRNLLAALGFGRPSRDPRCAPPTRPARAFAVPLPPLRADQASPSASASPAAELGLLVDALNPSLVEPMLATSDPGSPACMVSTGHTDSAAPVASCDASALSCDVGAIHCALGSH